MNENNLETVTSLSSDLSTRENITIQLEELLIAGNYDEAKLLSYRLFNGRRVRGSSRWMARLL